ncbi:MAG: hypothetical protein ACOYL6_04545 [Bacteriovoracaceae bacterium]
MSSTVDKSSSQRSFAYDLPVLISSGVYFSGLVGKSLITNQLKKATKKMVLTNVINEMRNKGKKH